MCARPEVVEVWDITAPDPPLLVFLKSYKNTVPVPRHWSQKRKYLQVCPAAASLSHDSTLFRLPSVPAAFSLLKLWVVEALDVFLHRLDVNPKI